MDEGLSVAGFVGSVTMLVAHLRHREVDLPQRGDLGRNVLHG